MRREKKNGYNIERERGKVGNKEKQFKVEGTREEERT